jgi:rubredoxin
LEETDVKIIQHGRPETVLNPIKRFKCVFCGCVFEAEKSEYQSGTQYNEIYFYYKCPECGKESDEVRMRVIP